MGLCYYNCPVNKRYATKALDYTYSQFAGDSTSYTVADVINVATATELEKTDSTLYGKLNGYTVCVGYSGSTYSCPGHRRADKTRTVSYAQDYNAGDLLSC